MNIRNPAVAVIVFSVLAVLALTCLVPAGFSAGDGGAVMYVVRPGDTLAKIAHRTYGDGHLYPVIAEANKLKDPHRILAGTTLVIPPSPVAALSSLTVVDLKPLIPGVTTLTVAPSTAPALALTPAGPLDLAPPTTGPLAVPFEWRKETLKGFGPGEKLTFAVRWQFITVGSATMEVGPVEEVGGRKAFHIITEARSAPFFDTFYKVRDTNESWMDVESLCSLKFVTRIDENNSQKIETLLLDQQKAEFQIVEKGMTGPTSPWVQDVLSSLYYLRTKDIEVGKTYSIDAHAGDKAWPLNVNVIKRERVKVPAGEFECFVVEPGIREGAGIFQAKGKLWIWLTADDRKIPVLMRSKIAVGAIEARLTEMQMPTPTVPGEPTIPIEPSTPN